MEHHEGSTQPVETPADAMPAGEKKNAKQVDWHGRASLQIKLGFLLIGVLIFGAWYAWLRFYAS